MRAHRLALWGLVVGAATAAAQVRPGIEVLLSDSAHLIAGKRLGLLTNHAGVDHRGRRDVDLLLAGGYMLTALFSPEHGFRGSDDRPGLADGVDSATGLPIYSLYGGARSLDFTEWASLDVVLVDLQDIGARYYTYVSTAVILMRDAVRHGKPVIVLDRPDPVGGETVQGNVRDAPAPFETFVGFLPVPMRHGLTLGELLRLANEALGLHAALTVVPAAGWRRSQYYDATGLPWVRPSPNMPDLESAIHYSGTCLFEGTNLSVGRGTSFAFQVIGAPWLDPAALLRRLRETGDGNREALAGVELSATRFTPRLPTDGKYDGAELPGIRLRVTDRRRYDPPRVAVALLAALVAAHRDSLRFRDDGFDRLAGGSALRAAIVAGRSGRVIWRAWQPALARFRRERAKYLLY